MCVSTIDCARENKKNHNIQYTGVPYIRVGIQLAAPLKFKAAIGDCHAPALIRRPGYVRHGPRVHLRIGVDVHSSENVNFYIYIFFFSLGIIYYHQHKGGEICIRIPHPEWQYQFPRLHVIEEVFVNIDRVILQ